MAALAALERNRFFYGKMMDVAQFEKEQSYFRDQQALLNRLVFGSGILSGLNVTADPNKAGNVLVDRGVAIDPDGHLIVVTTPFSINPAQPTDDQGKGQGSPVTSGTMLLRLVYAEVCADPVLAFVNDCDTPNECTASTVREVFQAWVVEQGTPPKSAVLLASVTIPGLIIDTSGRSRVVTNLVLSNAQVLRYVSGDGQSATAGQTLSAPVLVQVVDALGKPVSGVAVQFQTTGGSVAPPSATTGSDGRAQTVWTLGPSPGTQQATATTAGASLDVEFHATAS